MKRISFWALRNPSLSIILIVILFLPLTLTGLFAGRLLSELNVVLPDYFFFICLAIVISLFIFYPKQTGISIFHSLIFYWRRKGFEFAMAFVTFLIIVYAGNKNYKIFFDRNEARASFVVPIIKEKPVTNPLIKNFIELLHKKEFGKLTKKEQRRIIKDQLKAIRQNPEQSDESKVWLTILSITVAVIVSLGIAALSCYIACAGSGALSIVVLVVGLFFTIFFLVRILARIKRGKKREKKGSTPVTTEPKTEPPK